MRDQLADCADDRVLVLCNIVHSADLGGAAKPWRLCKVPGPLAFLVSLVALIVFNASRSFLCVCVSLAQRWTDRLMEEFLAEGDEERALGLEVTPLYNRKTLLVPAAQVCFLLLFVSFASCAA